MKQQQRIYFSLRLIEYFLLIISVMMPQLKQLSRGISKGRKTFNIEKLLRVQRNTFFAYIQSVYLIVDQICFIQYFSGYTMIPIDKLCKTLWTMVVILKPINKKGSFMIGLFLIGKVCDGLIGVSSSYIKLLDIPQYVTGLLGVSSNVFQLTALQFQENIKAFQLKLQLQLFKILRVKVFLYLILIYIILERLIDRVSVQYKLKRFKAYEIQAEFNRGHLKADPQMKLLFEFEESDFGKASRI